MLDFLLVCTKRTILKIRIPLFKFRKKRIFIYNEKTAIILEFKIFYKLEELKYQAYPKKNSLQNS